MKIIETSLEGCSLIELQSFDDQRGSFTRGFDQAAFRELGLPDRVEYTAEAINHAAFTLRGLHFQSPRAPEPKLVRCIRGVIFDVVVDIRQGSQSFGQWQSIRLEADDHTALLIQPGFAHGYLTLASTSVVAYHLFSPYVADEQRGLNWNDPDLGIDWPASPRVISERDRNFPILAKIADEDLNFSSAESISERDDFQILNFKEVS